MVQSSLSFSPEEEGCSDEKWELNFAPCKVTQDRLGFRLESTTWILDFMSLELGLRILIVSGVLDSFSLLSQPFLGSSRNALPDDPKNGCEGD